MIKCTFQAYLSSLNMNFFFTSYQTCHWNKSFSHTSLLCTSGTLELSCSCCPAPLHLLCFHWSFHWSFHYKTCHCIVRCAMLLPFDIHRGGNSKDAWKLPSPFLTRHGGIVGSLCRLKPSAALRPPGVWEDLMRSYHLLSDPKSEAGSVQAAACSWIDFFCMIERGKKGEIDWNEAAEKFHQLRSICYQVPCE